VKRRRRAWILGIVVALASIPGFLFWDAHRRATAAFDRHEAEIVRIVVDARNRVERPSIHGEGRPGNAFDHYRPVLKRFDAWMSMRRPMVPETNDLSVGALRDGLRCRTVDPAYEYERWETAVAPRLREARSTSTVLQRIARKAHKAGQDREALEVLVVLLGVAQDTLGRGTFDLEGLSGAELLVVTMAHEILTEHSLQAADLEEFAGKLDRLEQFRPRYADALDLRSALERRWVVVTERTGIAPKDAPILEPLWRDLFSARLARAHALSDIAEYYRTLKDIDSRPSQDRAELLQSIGVSPGVVRFGPDIMPYLLELKSLGERTAMRIAVAVAWYREEKGVFPAAIAELVPRHLPRLLHDPNTGAPLRLEAGRVVLGSYDWRVKRK
jgi:hypothetical protein